MLIHIEADNAEGPNVPLQKELIPISVRQIAEDHLRDYCRFTIFNSSAGITLIAAIDENNSPDRSSGSPGRYLQGVPESSGGHGDHRGGTQLPETFRNSARCISLRWMHWATTEYCRCGQTIYINDVEPVSRGKLKFDNADENDFITAVKFGPEEKIRETIHSLMARMDDAGYMSDSSSCTCFSLFNCVTRLMQQYDLTTRRDFLIRENSIWISGSHWKAGGI